MSFAAVATTCKTGTLVASDTGVMLVGVSGPALNVSVAVVTGVMTVMLNSGKPMVSVPSVTRSPMPVVMPISVSVGVPESSPVVSSKLAQLG